MRLFYFTGHNGVKNFGDELNAVIWRSVLPEILDDVSSELFVGIGTLLNNRIPNADKIVIMGSGVGYGELPTKLQQGTWTIYCLRGKLSAHALGVSSDLVATDPAILVNKLYPTEESKTHDFAFMPHWTNMGSSWNKLCDKLGIRLLDPRESVDNVIIAMKQSKVIIAEAMHGAIVADALRIPWIPVHSSFDDYSSFKWKDWGSSLNIEIESHAINKLFHTRHATGFQQVKEVVKQVLNVYNMRHAEMRLNEIIRVATPKLSGDYEFANALQKVEIAIEQFKSDFCYRN